VAIYAAFLYNGEAQLLLDIVAVPLLKLRRKWRETVESGSTANPSWSGVEV